MTTIALLTKVTRELLNDPPSWNTPAINTQDVCLDDIIGKDGDHIASFLYWVRQLSQLKGRTVKKIEFRVVDDKDCAIDGTIGFFRIEFEPA